MLQQKCRRVVKGLLSIPCLGVSNINIIIKYVLFGILEHE